MGVPNRVVLVLGSLLATAAAPSCATSLQAVVLADGLDRVTELRHVPAAGDHVYVAEQSGTIRLLRADGDVDDVFLDLSAQVLSTGFEQGLTGLAFAPSFPAEPSFFVHYIRSDGASVISRFRILAGDPSVGDAASEQVMLVLAQPSPIHNCNKLEFGPDGYLYIGCGDGGPGSDPVNNPADLANLYGKILRLDVDVLAPATYAVPPDNPFVGTVGAQPEIWASGLRNPYRFAFDPTLGDLWLGDVGQERQEELDHVPRTTPFGVDFGWNRMEGTLCFRPPSFCATAGLWQPIHFYTHVGGRCAIVAGPRLRGLAWGTLRDAVIFGDFCTGEVFALREQCGEWRRSLLLTIDAQITGFAFGVDDDLLVGTYGLGDAKVLRIARADEGFGDGFEDAPGCP